MPHKVLVVDDAMFMRAMIRDILVNSGAYEVVGEAANGGEAVEQYKAVRPDIVTMDIVMPQMDGIEATREVLKIDSKAKIVMCSALGQEALVIESIAAGAKDFIVKPFSAEKVLKVLDSVVAG
jgi:two-component system, chemotaxis family, chemotaxis protein CheY